MLFYVKQPEETRGYLNRCSLERMFMPGGGFFAHGHEKWSSLEWMFMPGGGFFAHVHEDLGVNRRYCHA